MRAARFPHLMTAALAIMALPAPALASGTPAASGGGSHMMAAKAPAKLAKPVNKPKPAKPAMDAECCTPDAAAAKAKPKAEACCEEGMKPGAKGAAADCCAAGMKAGAKPGADCCAAGMKAGAKHGADCSAEGMKAGAKHGADCSAEGMKAGTKHGADCNAEGKKAGAKAGADCCAEGMKAGAKPGADCCEAGAKGHAAKPMAMAKGDAPCCDHPAPDGSCCSPDKPHGAPGPGMRQEVRIEKRFEHGGRMGYHGGMMRGGHMGYHGSMMRANAVKGSEVRFMPAMAGGNQHIVLTRGAALQLNPWLSVGHQMNWALQLGNGPNAGPWVTPYGGFVGRLGAQLGPIRGDVGALVGLGGMLRTGQVMGATGPVNDVLQARAMWVVEPRVELGWRGEHMGLGLVGAYNFNPNMADFGGPSVGLKMTWKHPGGM